MELHHRLRRDPSWHPSGCNICGQLGHQAAQCTVGTVNWRAMYGDNAFKMRPAIFQSDLDSIKKERTPDFKALEEAAKQFAQDRLEGRAPLQQPPPQIRKHPAAAVPAGAAAGGAAAAAAPAAAGPQAAAKPPKADDEKRKAEDGLPEGWAVAFDAQRRPYYWHKTSKKVQWDKPTAATPIN